MRHIGVPGWARIAAVFVAGAMAACRQTEFATPPCPVPPMFAIPWTDTIAVGDTVRFRIPASDLVHTPERLIRWESDNERVATISPDSGLAHALAIGVAGMYGVDQNSPSNCSTKWYGTLRVRAIHDLPPDTLPHSAADSVLAFSVSRTALYTNDVLTATFVVTNPRADTLHLQGSGTCTFVVRAYDQSGRLSSPIEPHACTADIHFWATMPPHASFTQQVVWRANDGRNIGPPPPAPLPAGVYDLEPRVDAVGFLWVGKRVRVQVIVP